MRSHPNKAVDVAPCNLQDICSQAINSCLVPSSPVVHWRVTRFALAVLRCFLLSRFRWSVAHGLLLCGFRQSMA